MSSVQSASPITSNNYAVSSGKPSRLPLTRQQYYPLYDAGLLPERCELIEGDILPRIPQGPLHTQSLRRTERMLRQIFGEEFVFSQTPLVIDSHSEPEPDIFVTTQPETVYGNAQPPASEARLVVEVSDTTARYDLYDLSTKAMLYAGANINEYWVLDVNERKLHLHRLPSAGAYQSLVVVDEAAVVSSLSAPQSNITVKDLLP